MVQKRNLQELGGLPVIDTVPFRLSGDFPQTIGLQLISDCHIGSSIIDYSRIQWELDQARQHGRRILLGGDIFDCIFPSDRKRYRPESIHPRLRGRSDMADEALQWAAEIFSPYAELIDMIGVGNHEADTLQKHHTDLVARLVEILNEYRDFSTGSRIAQAGWSAFIRYKLENYRKQPGFLLWYHHRVSNAAYAHRVLRALQERSSSFLADVYWCGHNHVQGSMSEQRLAPVSGGLRSRPVKYVLTGSYFRPYEHQSQESMITTGRKSNYVVEACYPPASLGGAVVNLTWESLSPYPHRVEVTQ